ncbi:hypothetical protein KIN34_14455 [Cellulomonas sp. DKR-3]|uniref:Methylated-DNA-[protein]-cysteine S-methyltransferase DNA binding domain-containing protein n=1 Tax=Cellulomonas fulva TaxID=2835530 RepID=A0ABS5U272_9CELL|nr:hypothetical protein [Cellulomonas fulva]MBT0995485.1 hypothetical protein [Cellulomonas fulva]
MARKDRTIAIGQARAALIVAATRRTLLTYGELGLALGLDGVALRNELRHVLDDLSTDCIERDEPSLAALVINKDTGEPGSGWRDGPGITWHEEVRACFNYWQPV